MERRCGGGGGDGGGGGVLECNAPLNVASSSLPGEIIGFRMVEEPLRKQTETRRRVKQPPSRPQHSHPNLTLNGAISWSLLRSPPPDEKRRGCDGRRNYEAAAEEPSRRGNRCPDRVEGGGGWGWGSPPGAKRCSTPFSQSGAAWQYQPFHQPLNARPCLLADTPSECERSRFSK